MQRTDLLAERYNRVVAELGRHTARQEDAIAQLAREDALPYQKRRLWTWTGSSAR